MTYKQFCQTAHENNWTAEQLRCDVPPTEEILDFIATVGSKYESYCSRFCVIDSSAPVKTSLIVAPPQ